MTVRAKYRRSPAKNSPQSNSPRKPPGFSSSDLTRTHSTPVGLMDHAWDDRLWSLRGTSSKTLRQTMLKRPSRRPPPAGISADRHRTSYGTISSSWAKSMSVLLRFCVGCVNVLLMKRRVNSTLFRILVGSRKRIILQGSRPKLDWTSSLLEKT
jgi:hypothetical protein